MTGNEIVRADGKQYPVLDRRQVGRRWYLVLRRLGRNRSLAFDPHAGPKGELRLLHDLPKGNATKQHVDVLSRVNRLHSSLPILVEFQVASDRIVLVTKWVRGIEAGAYLKLWRKGGRPSPSVPVVISLFRKLAHAVSQLHDRLNIVHGDIHPGNVVLTYAPCELVLIDYGSAWFEANAKTRLEGDGINEFYAAPELNLPGAIVSERSDQFSILVMLHEFLTGELPFEGLGGKAGWPEFRNQFSAEREFQTLELRDSRKLPATIPTMLRELFRSGLALDANNRFQSSREFRDAIDAVDRELRQGSPLEGLNRIIADGISWITERFSASK